jgi:hypothetical protein
MMGGAGVIRERIHRKEKINKPGTMIFFLTWNRYERLFQVQQFKAIASGDGNLSRFCGMRIPRHLRRMTLGVAILDTAR